MKRPAIRTDLLTNREGGTKIYRLRPDEEVLVLVLPRQLDPTAAALISDTIITTIPNPITKEFRLAPTTKVEGLPGNTNGEVCIQKIQVP